MSLKDKIEIFGLTDIGLVRDHNEDSIGNNHDLGLVVLADGMGGHRGGEVASAITVSTILDTLARSKPGRKDDNSGYSLQSTAVLDAINTANTNVYNSSKENSHYRGMGTTVVVLLFYNGRFTVAHVGDSRLYRYRDGELEQLTRDHSLMQELVERGFYTPEQAEQSLNKNLVTRAVGIEENVEIDVFEGVVHPDDIYLLCSDGVTDMIDDDTIKNTISNNSENLEEIATELVRVSNDSGGKDNISAVLARPLPSFTSNPDNSLYSRLFELFS